MFRPLHNHVARRAAVMARPRGTSALGGRPVLQRLVWTWFMVIFMTVSPSDGGPLGAPTSITLQDNTPGVATKAIFRFTTVLPHPAGTLVTISGCPFTITDKTALALNPPSTTSVASGGPAGTVKITIDAPIPAGSTVEGIVGTFTTMGTEGVSGTCTITHLGDSSTVSIDNIIPGAVRQGQWLPQNPGPPGGSEYVVVVLQITAFSTEWKFDIPHGYVINSNWYQILAPGTMTSVSVTYTATELTITGTGGSIAPGALIAVAIDTTLPNPSRGLETFGIRCYNAGTLVDTGVGYSRPTDVASYGTNIGGQPTIETDDAAAGAVTRYHVQVPMPDAVSNGEQVIVSFPPTWYGDSGVMMDASPQVVFNNPMELTASATSWDDGSKILTVTLGADITAATVLDFTIYNVRNPVLMMAETHASIHTNPMINGPNGATLPAISPVLVPDAAFMPYSLATSAIGPANFSMTFLNGLPVGGIIEIYLETAWDGPVGPETASVVIDDGVDAQRTFSVTYSTSATVCSGQESPPDRVPVAFHGQLQGHVLPFPGSYSKPSASSGDQLKLVLQGQPLAPGTKATVIIPDMVNPSTVTAATLASVGVWWNNCTTPMSLLSHVTVTGIGASTGALTSTSVTLGDATPSRSTDFIVTFTPQSTIPINGVIVVQLPYLGLWHFKMGILSSTHAVTVSGIDGAAVLNVIDRRLEITVSTSIAAGTQVNVTVPDITTPAVAGPIGGAIISTWSAGQVALIDGYSIAPLPRLNVAPLGDDMELELSGYDSAEVIDMTFTFTTTADIHDGASISLLFPTSGWVGPGTLAVALDGAPDGVTVSAWGFVSQSHTLWLILSSVPYATPSGTTITVEIGTGFTSPTVAQPGYVELRVHDYGTTQQQTEKLFIGGIGLPENPVLTLESVFPCNATFSWSAPSDGGSPITGYKLYHNNGTSTPNAVLAYDGTGTSTAVPDLLFPFTYTFIATAVTALGESSITFPVTGTPVQVNTPGLQANDVNLVLTADSPEQVTIDVRNLAVFCVSEYHLFWDGGVGDPWVLNRSYIPRPYVVTGLSPGVTYAFAISVGGAGPVNDSAIVAFDSITTLTPQVATAPSTPVVIDVNTTMITVNVSITDVTENSSPVHTVSVYRNDGAGGSATIFVGNASVSVAGSVLWASVAATGLNPGRTYEIRATVHNGIGESSYSPSVTRNTYMALPSAPVLATAVAVNGSRITVNVSLATVDNGGGTIDVVSLYRDDGAASAVSIVVGNVTASSQWVLIDVDNLQSGTSYVFEATVWNSQGESGRSGAVNATTTATIPCTPGPALVDSTNATVAFVNWTSFSCDGGDPITSYTVYTDAASPGGDIDTSLGSFILSKLVTITGTPLLQLRATVTARNSIGESSPSTVININFAAGTVPTVPGQPVLVQATSSSISVNWTTPSYNGGYPITGYMLYVNDQENTNLTSPVTSGTVTSLTSTTEYKIHVVAWNALGGSVSSASTNITTAADSAVAPDAPTSLAFSSITYSSLVISWTAPADGGSPILGYDVYSDFSGPGGPLMSLMNTTGTGTSVIHSGLSPSTTYRYQVAARNSKGVSPLSNLSSVTSADPSAPSAPTSLSSTAQTASTVKLSWSAPSSNGADISKYEVFTDSATGGAATTLAHSGTSTSPTVTGLLGSKDYRFMVRAVNSAGSSVPSSVITVSTKAPVKPGSPVSPSISDVKGDSMKVSWSVPVDSGGSIVTSYNLMWDQGDTGSTLVKRVTTTSTSVVVDKLTPSTAYKFHVIATNGIGDSSASSDVSGTTTKPSKPELVFADLPAKIYSSQNEIVVGNWLTVKPFDFAVVTASFAVTANSDVFAETPKLTWASDSKIKGSLMFTPSAAKFGDGDVTLTVTYQPKAGGSSSTLTHEFTISVTKAPAIPSLTLGSSDDLTVKRNAPKSVLTDWFKVDPASTITNMVVVLGNTTHPIFAESPTVTYPGSDNEHATLSFKPSDKYFGQVDVKVYLEYADGLLQTTPVSFVITVQRDMFLGDGKPRILGSIATQDKVKVSENGDSQTFTVSLSVEPSTDVTVTATSSDTGEVTIFPASLTFTTSAYSVAQTLTMTGVDDPDDDGDVAVDIQVQGTEANAMYDGVLFEATVVNTDNETASWTLRTLGGVALTPGALLFENGTNEDVVVISIEYQPAAPIEIPLSSTPDGGLQFIPATVAFTDSDWSTAQTVTIRAVDDHVAGQGTRNVTALIGPIQSTDIWYSSLQKSISYKVSDDDYPELLVTSPEVSALLEDGGEITLTVSLSAIPLTDVLVTAVVSQHPDLGRALVSLSTMEWVITTGRWNDKREVTVTGIQDNLKLGMQNVYITFNTSSQDRLFNNLGYGTVVVHIDDDGSGIMTSPISGPVSEAGGTIEMYIAPAGPDAISTPESVTVVSSDVSEVIVQPGSIALNPSDWSNPQVITIRGVDDNERDGDKEVTLTMRSTTIGVREFTVINRDDDLPEVTLTYVSDQGDKDIITELGQSRDIHARLSIAPTDVVTAECKPSIVEEAKVVPSTLTFTPSDYSQTRVVTVTGIPDYTEDADRRVDVTCTVTKSEDGNYVAGTASALSFLNKHYSFPSIKTLKPSVSSLNGTIITMVLESIDPRATTITIGGIPMEYNVSQGAQRGLQSMSIDVHHQYQYSFHSPLIDQEGYVTVEISNPNGAKTVIDDVLYYTSDCPIEGMFGRGTACKPCPQGAVCPGGFRLIPQVGYWNSEESSGYVVKCEPERCLGGVGSPCAPGYTGKACSACQSKYYLEGPLCIQCEGTEKELALLIGVAALFFSALTIAAFLAKDMTLTHVATMMVAVQLLQRVGALSAPYLPRWMQQYYAAMSIITLNISFLRPECSGMSGYTGRLIGDAIVLFVAYTPVTIGLPVMGYIRVRRARSKEDFVAVQRYRFFYKHRLPRSLLILWSLLYLHVTSRFSEALFCKEYDGELYLVADTTMKCFETEHTIVFVLCVIALLIFSVGVPIAGFVLMIKFKHQLYRRHILARFGFLYESFKPKFYLSHYATTMVSFAIAVGTVLMTGAGSTRYIVTGLVFCAYAVAIVYFQPYKHTWKNWSTAAVICIAFLGTVLLLLADNDADIDILRGLAITIFVLSVLMMLILVIFLVRFVLQSEELLKRFSILRRFTSNQASKRASSKYEGHDSGLGLKRGFSVNPSTKREGVNEDEIDRAMEVAASDSPDPQRLSPVGRNTNELEMQSTGEYARKKGPVADLSTKGHSSPSMSDRTALSASATALGDGAYTDQALGASNLDLDWISDLADSRALSGATVGGPIADDDVIDNVLLRMEHDDQDLNATIADVEKEMLRTQILKGEEELDSIDATLRVVDSELARTHGATVKSTQVLDKVGEHSPVPVRSTKSEVTLFNRNVRAKNLLNSSETCTSDKSPSHGPTSIDLPLPKVPKQLLYTESQVDSGLVGDLAATSGPMSQRDLRQDSDEPEMAFRYPLNRPSTTLIRRSTSHPDLTSRSGLSKSSRSPTAARLGERSPIERSPLVRHHYNKFAEAMPSSAPHASAGTGALEIPPLAGSNLYHSNPGNALPPSGPRGSVGSLGDEGDYDHDFEMKMQDYDEMVASLPNPNLVAPVPSAYEDAALEDILRNYLTDRGYDPPAVNQLPVPQITRVDDDDLSWLDEDDF